MIFGYETPCPNVVSTNNKQRAVEPRLFFGCFKKLTQSIIGVQNAAVQGINVRVFFFKIFGYVVRVMRRERKEKTVKRLGRLGQFLGHKLQHRRVPYSPIAVVIGLIAVAVAVVKMVETRQTRKFIELH